MPRLPQGVRVHGRLQVSGAKEARKRIMEGEPKAPLSPRFTTGCTLLDLNVGGGQGMAILVERA